MYVVTGQSICVGCGDEPLVKEIEAPNENAAKGMFQAMFPMHRITKVIHKP
tara:strand:- start:19827 stop:19979 length:153 start_codon:yes stop_codon:yes gene_type:complete